jgi:hypothetical protein
MKDKVNIPDWAQGALLIGAAAGVALWARRRARSGDQRQIAEMTWSAAAENPFNWRSFFGKISPSTIVTRYTDGGVAQAAKLYELFGYFNEDESAIMAFFAGIRTQYQVAQIAKQMFEKHGIELTALLADGRRYWLPNVAGGLKQSEIAEIYRNVKSKPRLKA